jgi:hypothetical protein
MVALTGSAVSGVEMPALHTMMPGLLLLLAPLEQTGTIAVILEITLEVTVSPDQQVLQLQHSCLLV